MAAPLSIYGYLDFRQYVRDYVESRKRENPGVSYRSFAYRLGINPGFFNRVLGGARNLSEEHVLRLAELLKLTKREQQYFELLVHYTQAKKQTEQNHYFQQLEAYRATSVKQVSERQYAIYSHWYYSVLRELLHFVRTDGGAEQTSKTLSRLLDPAVPSADVREALQILEDQGFVTRTAKGAFELNEAFITSGAAIPAVVINRVLVEFMELARGAIDRAPRTDRSLSTLTFSTSRKGFELIRSKLDEYRREILNIVSQEKGPDRVYHLNLHLFPVSKPHKGGAT